MAEQATAKPPEEKETFSHATNSVEDKHSRSTSPKCTSHDQYADKRADLESINKQLLEMKERLMENIYKVHLLQVDLASQFNPHVVENIRTSETTCNQCAATMTEGK